MPESKRPGQAYKRKIKSSRGQQSYRRAFRDKMKIMDTQERARAAEAANEKRRKLLEMSKKKSKQMGEAIEKKVEDLPET